ncbi:MAG: hypothetical protein JWM47_1951 [Acidimicrobiales bacterium]|nr:hypothetical protein [Acidimicrobiales bacterium]
MTVGRKRSVGSRSVLVGLVAVAVLTSSLFSRPVEAMAGGSQLGLVSAQPETTGALVVLADGSAPRPCCSDFGSTYISDDGRYVTYSAAVPAGQLSGAVSGTFQFDAVTGQTSTVAAGNDSTGVWNVTPDGRYVLVASSASDLLPGVVAAAWNLYQWDRETGELSAVSGTPAPSQLASHSFAQSMSADGRFVVFESNLPGTVAGMDSSERNLYVWDRTDGTTVAITGGDGPSGGSLERLDDRYVGAPITDDGRYVTFSSWATDLTDEQADGTREIYQWDRSTGRTTRITRLRLSPALLSASVDGRYVTFDVSQNLYQWDRSTGVTTVVSDGGGDRNAVHVSRNGDAVLLWGQRVLPGDIGDVYRPYVWDRATQSIEHLLPSVDMVAQDWGDTADPVVFLRPTGELGLWHRGTRTTDIIVGGRYEESFKERGIELSADEQMVTWTSARNDGSAGPRPWIRTAHQWDRATQETALLVAPDADADVRATSRDGRAVVLSSLATNLGGTQTSDPSFYLWRRDVTSTVPNAPWPASAVPSDAQVTLNWTLPVPNGSGPVTGYRITPAEGSADVPPVEVGPETTTAVIAGLSNQTTYRFRIEARNGSGYGVRSGPTEPVTPYRAPSAPTMSSSTAGNGFVDLTWTPPDHVGEPALTQYLVTTYRDGEAQGAPFGTTGPQLSARISGLTNGARYQFTVRARGAAVSGPESPRTAEVTPTAPGPVFVPLEPCRLLDTRAHGGGRLTSGTTRTVAVTGVSSCPIPPDALAIEATISALAPTSTGYLRAWPSGTPNPNATFLNYAKEISTSNTGTVAVATGPDGGLTLQVSGGGTHAVVDVQGYYLKPSGPPIGSAFVATIPCRVFDSRHPNVGRFGRGEVRNLRIIGQPACNVPPGAVAVEATITAVAPSGTGFLRAGPAGSPEPGATFLNFTAGRSTTNTGTIAINGQSDSNLLLSNHAAATDYVIDIQGWFLPVQPDQEAPGAVFQPIRPCRILDSRTTATAMGPDSLRQVNVTGGSTCGVPVHALAVEATISAVSPTTTGFLQAGPSNAPAPAGTFLNYSAGRSMTNTGTIAIDPNGHDGPNLTLRNRGGTTDYVIEVQGYFVPA